MSQIPNTYPFGGGLDTNSAALAIGPGAVLFSENYEPLAEGYGRSEGYERFDGRAAPSDATFYSLRFDAGEVEFALDDVVEGATSGATGVVVGLPVSITGSYVGNDAAGEIAITAVTGTFQDNEVLEVASIPYAVADNTPYLMVAPNPEVRAERLAAAEAYYRALIQAVPGSGPVRGVAVYNGAVYAWRNNAGGTACVCHKATTAGWVAVPVLYRMNFTAGVSEPAIGATLNGLTSAATGTIQRLVVTSGTWGAGTAAGHMDLSDITGAFVAETVRVGVTNIATGAAVAAVTLPPGGRYRTINHNFFGATNLYRLYGVNGVGKAFEMVSNGGIGTINTGMASDIPTRIFEIANHLGLAFAGGSLQFSGTGEPAIFDPLLGAGEIGLGTEVTDIVQANETAVAVFGEKKIAVLQGHDINDFVLDTLTEEAGAFADSAQRIAKTVYIDDRGLRSLDATQAYGDFKAGALSGRFERYFRRKRDSGVAVLGSYVSRRKSQYRVVWDDGSGLSVYMGNKVPEALVTSLAGITPFCFGSGELADGEGLFVGAEDGFVYRLDKGNTFDGTAFDYYLVLAYNHFGNPTQEDRFHKIVLEMIAPVYTLIGVTALFDYSEGDKPSANADELTIYGGGGLWNLVNYNEFIWSSASSGRAEFPIDGLGRNASFIFTGTSAAGQDPHILQAYTVYRSRRKFLR